MDVTAVHFHGPGELVQGDPILPFPEPIGEPEETEHRPEFVGR